MVSALVSSSSPDQGDCVVFLGKTLNSHSASLYLGVEMCKGEFNAGGSPSIPSRKGGGGCGVEMLLVG